MAESVEIGYQAFLADGDEEFGAIRAVTERTVTVYVENGGDFEVPRDAIRAVHSQKVVFDGDKLDTRIREAIRHAHDQERV